MLLAARFMPASSEEWVKAMLSEFYHCDNCRKALSWAAGCLLASCKMRIKKMVIGNMKISRWLLGPELIFCFFPLIFTWLESLFWLSMTNLVTFEYSIGNSVQPIPYVILNFSIIILGTLAPLSLFVAFRSIILDVHLPGKLIRLVLFVGPLLLGVIYTLCWSLLGLNSGNNFWSGLFLLSALPALGMGHMIYIYSPDDNQPAEL